MYENTNWIDGTACAYDRNVSTKAIEFIVNNTNSSFYLFVYFSTPDCSGHAHTDQSLEYNLSFIEVDRALGMLLDALRDQGIENHTQIIVTADHGWNAGTAGHSTFNDDTAILPLITNNYIMIANATTAGFRKQCDIAPTTLHYFGMNASAYPDITGFGGCGSMYNPLYTTPIIGPVQFNETTTLAGDVYCNNSCITFGTNDTALLCDGHTVYYNINGSSDAYAILLNNNKNITISDCILQDTNESGEYTNAIVVSDTNNSIIAVSYTHLTLPTIYSV